MKNWKLFSLVLFAFMSLSLVSCGDDDEVGDSNALVGTWQCTWIEGYEKYANNPEYDEEWNEADDFTTTFNADGTTIADGDAGKWKLEGNILTMTFPDDGGSEDDIQIYTVLKLTDSELVLEMLEKGENYEYYDKSTFKKI